MHFELWVHLLISFSLLKSGTVVYFLHFFHDGVWVQSATISLIVSRINIVLINNSLWFHILHAELDSFLILHADLGPTIVIHLFQLGAYLTVEPQPIYSVNTFPSRLLEVYGPCLSAEGGWGRPEKVLCAGLEETEALALEKLWL